ncbi:MAG: ABC transporter substrate-binding protein [Desulfobacterium sp.]|nr:ABC transporter substrate-binding protein [Desulfobacterium sp.]
MSFPTGQTGVKVLSIPCFCLFCFCYYTRAGFKVKIIKGTPGNRSVEEVISGRANYGMGRSEILLHRLHGLPLVVLAAVSS